ncbi:MAG: PD-(D/E)XK nuclease family protein [Candidatus Pacearchaeota archaeon]
MNKKTSSNLKFKLSPSSMNLMKECPRCFWLEKHGVWKRPRGIFPSLPSGMDRILKIHFDKFMEKGELPPELCENNMCDGMKLFDDKKLLKIWQNNWRGITWTDDKGNFLRGAVDNILEKGKKLIVLDYKTRGYDLKENTHEFYRLQMDLYNFLLRKNGYLTEDFAFLLFYVPKEVTKTGEIIFDTTLKKIKVSVENAEKEYNKAIKLLEGECPKKGCEWCERF